MKVTGTSYDAVTYGVCEELGYKVRSRKGLGVSRIVNHTLDWYRLGYYDKIASENITEYSRTKKMKRDASRYVQRQYGMWGILFFWVISAVVNMIIEWLLSDDSSAFRGQS